MITAIEIENFKGFRERQRFDLAPMTLMFGANSSGKSSVFHAVFFLRQLFRSAADHIWEFQQYSPSDAEERKFLDVVHGGDPTRIMAFRVELTPQGDPRLGDSITGPAGEYNWNGNIDRFVVEIRVGATPAGDQYISHYSIYHDDEFMIAFDRSVNGQGMQLSTTADVANLADSYMGFEDLNPNADISVRHKIQADENLGFPINFNVEWALGDVASQDASPEDASNKHYYSETTEDIDNALQDFYEASLLYLWRCFDESLYYVGPLREIPKESEWPGHANEHCTWNKGLAAWQLLSSEHRNCEEVRGSVNQWLRRLGTCASIVLEDHGIVRMRANEGDENSSSIRIEDVGTGISQVVPIIGSLQIDEAKLALFEQPELHLHPKMQAELGDLFIETCVHGKRSHAQAIVETHSEHLILRLLRRIRETEIGKSSEDRKLRTDDLSIYYLKQENGASRAVRIDVDVNGEFIQPWPDDFFEIDFYERFPDAR
jgi:predicted ATPase